MTKLTEPTILIIDDTLPTLNQLLGILSKTTMKVVTESDPREIWNRLREVKPHLLLMDVSLPLTDTYKVCEKLKRESEWSNMGIILFSSPLDLVEKGKSFSVGAWDHFLQPFEEKEIIARVAYHLQHFRLLSAKKVNEDRLDILQKEIDHLRSTISANENGVDLPTVAQLVYPEKLKYQFLNGIDCLKVFRHQLQRYLKTSDPILLSAGAGFPLMSPILSTLINEVPNKVIRVIESTEEWGFLKKEIPVDKTPSIVVLNSIIHELPIDEQEELHDLLSDSIHQWIITSKINPYRTEHYIENKFDPLWLELSIQHIELMTIQPSLEDWRFIADSLLSFFSQKLMLTKPKLGNTFLDQLKERITLNRLDKLETFLLDKLDKKYDPALKLVINNTQETKEVYPLPIKEPLNSLEKRYITSILETCNWKVEGINGAASILELHPNTLRHRIKKLGIKKPF